MDIDKEWLEVLLDKVNQRNAISKVIKVETTPATTKGDNYTSIMSRVTMQVILKSGKRKVTSIIVKDIPQSVFMKTFWDNSGIFKREILMYRDILPNLEEILLEFNDYTEPMWGKLLYFRQYDKLVFEDLKRQGYLMGDRKQGLDMDHCALVLRSLAKFHASSVILKERGQIFMDVFGLHMIQKEGLRPVMEKMNQESFKKLVEAMENKWEPEWMPVAEKIKTKIAPNIGQLLKGLLNDGDQDKFKVLCHGDCWVNNMLFKYGLDNHTPISVKFVDFQISFYNSPAFDLKYFLSTSVNIEIRNTSINKLVEIYHDALLKQFELYNYKGNIITLDCLRRELERLDLYGLVVTMGILPIVLLEDANEFPEMEKILKNASENKATIEWNQYETSSPTFIKIIKDTLRAIERTL